MGTRMVTRSGEKKQRVFKKPIEKKCVTILGLKTKVWTFPPSDDMESSLSSSEEEDQDESADEFDGITLKKQLHEPPVFSDVDSQQHIQNRRMSIFVGGSTRVEYFRRRRSQRLAQNRLAQNLASVPRFNSSISIEKKCVTVLGLKTKVWTFPPSHGMESYLSEEEEEEEDRGEYVIERSCCIGTTTPTNSAMGGDLGV